MTRDAVRVRAPDVLRGEVLLTACAKGGDRDQLPRPRTE